MDAASIASGLGRTKTNSPWQTMGRAVTEGNTRPTFPSTRNRSRVADFKTHITGSTIVGAVYGYWGSTTQAMPIESSLVAAGLCSVSGMLPDLDSESGVPVREATMFASAVVPMLALGRLRELNLSPEAMVLAAGLIYVTLRFIIAEIFKRYTVHRGMWHSIPAAASAGLVAYLIMPSMEEHIRIYKTAAVVLGFMVHLILDEIWAIHFRGGRFRLKKSFGTALKFWGPKFGANFSVYAKLILLLYLAYHDTNLFDQMHRFRLRSNERPSELRWDDEVANRLTPWR